MHITTYLAPAVLALAVSTHAPTRDDAVVFEDLHLQITPLELEGVKHEVSERDLERASWKGKLGTTEIHIQLLKQSGAFGEPDAVIEYAVDNMSRGKFAYVISEDFFLQGDYGFASFAACSAGEVREEGRTGSIASRYLLSSLLPDGAYIVQVDCTPRADKDVDAAVRKFFEDGVVYDGDERDAEWTQDQVRDRWLQDTPDDLHEDFLLKLRKPGWVKKAIIRTDHYLVMTNSSGGKAFAKQLEKNYDEIRKIYPFAEVKGRQLMPVFLFQNADEYYGFYARKTGISKQQAARSKGHAFMDYYATWYEEPGDPVHIHEQVHQIFKNRLSLWGGGSWFQEGVAEYVSSSKPDRVGVAYLVKKDRHTKMRDFCQLPSLLYSSNPDGKTSGGSEAGDHYKQAALFIEFLREDKKRKKQFPDFLQRMGKVPRGYMKGIADVFQDVYGETIDEVDAAFQAYAKKR
tara:strand:- start:350 stop:1729 length:1380 start_codon:yes stop_codon:yes gene_type:complete